jgi:hypothetical protein
MSSTTTPHSRPASRRSRGGVAEAGTGVALAASATAGRAAVSLVEGVTRSAIPFLAPLGYLFARSEGWIEDPSWILFLLAVLLLPLAALRRRTSDLAALGITTTCGLAGLALSGQAATLTLFAGWLVAAVLISPLIRWLVKNGGDLSA